MGNHHLEEYNSSINGPFSIAMLFVTRGSMFLLNMRDCPAKHSRFFLPPLQKLVGGFNPSEKY